jgi:hypothetical protein
VVPVHVEPVDAQKTSWEDHRPRFRVLLFERPDHTAPFHTSAYDVTGAEVPEVLSWAEDQAGDEGLYAVALVGRNPRGEPGLTWLVGMDANDAPGHDLRQEMIRTAMHARRGRRSTPR